MLRMILFSTLILMSLFACKKDEYYRDSGTQDPHFNGNALAYLDAVPFFFDSLAQIVRLSGMEDVFTKDTLTFFAPTDRSIMNLVELMNDNLYMYGYDTIKTLSDVPQVVWQKYLQRYMFHGANQLKDYPQIDFSLKSIYPGQDYLSWNNTTMNIGAIYTDDNGVKYVGYRQLTISYIPDLTYPYDNWNTAMVSSSNILTDNGVVHTLDKDHNYFGFDIEAFLYDMISVMQTGG
ncbi:fasciclin domain-containing protein [Chitinophaga sancti]|uniref:fasciclin domain-containing protein n=1 Tax=Chitinophaga sancti TaxID=1004 RepID=UPI002A763281|nr:fasciclin domain-containing protein [Chitinophaga sancti]WPQ65234.1 fasciclin domain-containing protein [Chitinophaga sancti]